MQHLVQYLAILLIVAVLAFGAILSTSTPAQTTLCGVLAIPDIGPGEVLSLVVDENGNPTSFTVKLGADLDSDGDVDLDDYAIFAAAFTGPR